jgi:hypothetical protein
MRNLLDHTDARGAAQSARLLRYRDGRAITARRYDYLWARIRQQLPVGFQNSGVAVTSGFRLRVRTR